MEIIKLNNNNINQLLDYDVSKEKCGLVIFINHALKTVFTRNRN